MRLTDLIAFGLFALRRHKLRTALTILGVMIGTATLVVSVSIGLGVSEVIDEQFRKDDLRQVTVLPSHDGFAESFDGVPDEILQIKGDMSEPKRERIKKLKAMDWKQQNARPAPKPLTPDRIAQLAALPHVVDVIPELDEYGRAFLFERNKYSNARIYGIPHNYARFAHRIEAGGRFSSPDAKECIVHEYLLYRLGVENDADVRAMIGKPIRIEFTNARRTPLSILSLFGAEMSNLTKDEMDVLEKTWNMLPDFMKSIPLPEKEKETLLKAISRKKPGALDKKERKVVETFTIVGVIRAPMKDDKPDNGFLDGPLRDADIIIPRQVAENLFLQLPYRAENGYSRVRLVVDRETNVEEVVGAVKTLGLHEFSLGAFVQQMRRNTLLITFAMDFIALIALIVAALGIMNTMFTAVLERTREIGILKAVGAKDRQILFIFLFEGGLIGLLGGIGGIFLGWLASLPGNDYALRILERQGHSPMPETVFLYPIKLLIAVPLFAMLMTTLAALLPARRAARVEPVIALRHE